MCRARQLSVNRYGSLYIYIYSPYTCCFLQLSVTIFIKRAVVVVGRTLLNRFWHDFPLFGAVISKKKLFYLCTYFDGIFFIRSKIQFQDTFVHVKVLILFLIYKKLQLFFWLFENFHFPTSPPFFNEFFSNFVQI